MQGRNIRLTSLITMGECWHNNHHAFPGSARLGLHEGEWDPGWWVLLLLRRVGLVWGLKLPCHLAHRPELSIGGAVQTPSRALERARLSGAGLQRPVFSPEPLSIPRL